MFCYFTPLLQELREWHAGIPIVHIHNLRLALADLRVKDRFDTAMALQRALFQHFSEQLMSQWYKVRACASKWYVSGECGLQKTF